LAQTSACSSTLLCASFHATHSFPIGAQIKPRRRTLFLLLYRTRGLTARATWQLGARCWRSWVVNVAYDLPSNWCIVDPHPRGVEWFTYTRLPLQLHVVPLGLLTIDFTVVVSFVVTKSLRYLGHAGGRGKNKIGFVPKSYIIIFHQADERIFYGL
jgi:hypothetical protein